MLLCNDTIALDRKTPLAGLLTAKRYKPEEIVAKLRQVDVLVSQGQNMVDAIRQIGVSEVTYYRWRQEFGGLKIEQVKRLKDLELENSRFAGCSRSAFH
jgi:putative transposase